MMIGKKDEKGMTGEISIVTKVEITGNQYFVEQMQLTFKEGKLVACSEIASDKKAFHNPVGGMNLT